MQDLRNMTTFATPVGRVCKIGGAVAETELERRCILFNTSVRGTQQTLLSCVALEKAAYSYGSFPELSTLLVDD